MDFGGWDDEVRSRLLTEVAETGSSWHAAGVNLPPLHATRPSDVAVAVRTVPACGHLS